MTSSTPNIGSDDLDDTDEHPMISEGGAGTSLQHSASNNSHHTASQGGSTHGVSRTRTLQMLSETFKLRKKKPPTQVGSPPKSSTSQLASASSLPNTNAPFSGDVLLSSPPLNITQSPSKSSSMRRKDTGSNLGGPAQGQPVAAISSPHSRSASESLDDLAFGGPPGRREGSYGGGLAPGSFLSLDDGMSPPPPEGEGAAPEGRSASCKVHQRLAPVHDFNPTSRPNNPLSKVLVPFRMMKPLVPKSASKAIAKPAAATRGLLNRYGTKKEGSPPTGYVWLWMGGFLRWRRRFIIASPEAPGVVMIYKGIKLKGKVLSISLRDATVEADEQEARQLKIVTHTKGRIFVRATDEHERNDWVACLHESIRLYAEKQRMVDTLKEQGLLPRDSVDGDSRVKGGGLDRHSAKGVKLLEVADMDADQRRCIRSMLSERMTAAVPYQQEVERHMSVLSSSLLSVVSGLNMRLPSMNSVNSIIRVNSFAKLQPTPSAEPTLPPPPSAPTTLPNRLPTRRHTASTTDAGDLAESADDKDSTRDGVRASPGAGAHWATPYGRAGYGGKGSSTTAIPEIQAIQEQGEGGALTEAMFVDPTATLGGPAGSGAANGIGHGAGAAGPAVAGVGASGGYVAAGGYASGGGEGGEGLTGIRPVFSRSRPRNVSCANLQQAYSQLLEELRFIIHKDVTTIVQLEAENSALRRTLKLVQAKSKTRAIKMPSAGSSDSLLSFASAETADEDAFDVDDTLEDEMVDFNQVAGSPFFESSAAMQEAARPPGYKKKRAAHIMPPAGAGVSDVEAAEMMQQKEAINALAAVRQVEYVEKQQQREQLTAIMATPDGGPAGLTDEDGEGIEHEEEEEEPEEAGPAEEFYELVDAAGNVLPPPAPGTLPERRIRTSLPAPKPLGRGFSVWTILKNMIGKDLSRITMPATINEPTSLLQRLAEAYEYYPLLDMAATVSPENDSVTRLMLVSTWVLSCYNSQALRLGKPFNPLLGETYEWQSNDSSVRFLCEQVSHHPPVSVYHAEGCSGAWKAFGEYETKTKFWGKSIEAILHGCEGLNLTEHNEEYRWNKALICVHDVIFGNFWVEVYGKITVFNKTTGESALLNIKPCNGKLENRGNFEGAVMDAKGKEVYKMSGNILSNIYAAFTPAAATARGASTEPVLIWEKLPNPDDFEEQYNFTQMTIGLNDPGDPIVPFLPPTDARFRSDQMAMEMGEWTSATSEKLRLEEKQRVARRLLKEKGLSYKPMWFSKADPNSKELVKLVNQQGFAWEFNDQYWVFRKQRDWNGCMDLYTTDPPV